MNVSWIKVAAISIALLGAGYFIGNMHKNGKKYDRFVQVKGLSEKEVEADMAVWPITITLSANDLISLKTNVETQKEALYNFFLERGFDKEELNSGSANISDSWSDLYRNNTAEFRYLAKSDFTVRTKNIDKLQKAVAESTQLMSKGILLSSKNPWRPIEYSFTGLNDIKPAMIEESTKNAREVADKFAMDSKAQVGKIRQAKQGFFSISDRDQNTPQIKLVRVVSTIDFQLED